MPSPAQRDAVATREIARRSIALYGGVVSGLLALIFFLVAPLVGVPFVPTAAVGYGTVLNLLHIVIWLPCLVVTTVNNVPELISFTLIVHAIASAVDLGAWITLVAYVYTSIISGNTTAALHFVFVAIVLSVQLVLVVLTTVALWRLGRQSVGSGYARL